LAAHTQALLEAFSKAKIEEKFWPVTLSGLSNATEDVLRFIERAADMERCRSNHKQVHTVAGLQKNSGPTDLVATFTEPGPLGLTFSPFNGNALLVSIDPGSQAARYTQLRPGLRLLGVGNSFATELSYTEALQLLQIVGRPCTFRFGPEVAHLNATFTEAGSLGLKFTPVQGEVQVLAVNPGTQAEQHMQLRPGLVLAAVAGRDVSGLAYAEVITQLKQAGRPVVLSFTHESRVATVTGVGTVASSRDKPVRSAKDWLPARYDPTTANGIVAAFRRAEYAEDDWLKELESDGTPTVLVTSLVQKQPTPAPAPAPLATLSAELALQLSEDVYSMDEENMGEVEGTTDEGVPAPAPLATLCAKMALQRSDDVYSMDEENMGEVEGTTDEEPWVEEGALRTTTMTDDIFGELEMFVATDSSILLASK
jgi:hypothetical protein